MLNLPCVQCSLVSIEVSRMKKKKPSACHSPAGSLLDGLCTPPPAPISTFFSFSNSFSAVFLLLLCFESVRQNRNG